MIESFSEILHHFNGIHFFSLRIHHRSYQYHRHLNNFLRTAIQTQKNFLNASQIHAQIIVNSYTSFSPSLLNNLINLYTECGHFNRGLNLFRVLPLISKTIVTWTSLITHLSHHHMPIQALTFFENMRSTGVFPNQFTFSTILPACANTTSIIHGEQMLSLIYKHGFHNDVFVGSALVDMYAKCCDMVSAQKFFDQMPERNFVSWNSLMVGFLQNEFYDQAFKIFKSVLKEMFSPDQVCFSSILCAAAPNIGGLRFGRQVHGMATKYGLTHLPYIKNALTNMYAKCGAFVDATRLLHTMTSQFRDAVTWNIIITGYVHNNNFEEAYYYFYLMMRVGISPDHISCSSVLQASSSLLSLNQGTSIHDLVIKIGLTMNTYVSTSLLSMYAKCGCLMDAFRVFRETEIRNTVFYTAMIGACQTHGLYNEVFNLFDNMILEGIKPSYSTFICVLSSCSHTGRVQEGIAYFNSMSNVHRLNPRLGHYACLVDLLGRSGRLKDAKRVVESMPTEPDAFVWGALLGACKVFGDLEMGKEVAERLFAIQKSNSGNYVLLSDMYKERGRLREANEVRTLMVANGVRKECGVAGLLGT